MNMNTGEMEAATATEGEALAKDWNDLGPLISFGIRKLGKEIGLEVCRGLSLGHLQAEWNLKPGVATCTITQGAKVLYSFEFKHEPSRFMFAEVDGEQAN